MSFKKNIKKRLKWIYFSALNFFSGKKYIVNRTHSKVAQIRTLKQVNYSHDFNDSDYLNRQKLMPNWQQNPEMSSEAFLEIYSNVYIDLTYGVAVDMNLNIITQSLKNPEMKLETEFFKVSPYREYEGPIILINGALNARYFHAWFDGILKLYYLSKHQSQRITILIYATAPPLYHWILDKFQHQFDYEIITDCRFVKVKHYWLIKGVYFAKHAPYISKDITQFFKETLVSNLSLVRDKKIFIKRKSSDRDILNQTALEAVFVTAGYELIQLEDLCFQEQIDYFYRATHVAGLHGAGFTNLLFCQPGTYVLELQNYAAVTTYYMISKQLGLHYQYVFPNEFDFEAIVDPYLKSKKYYHQKLLPVSFSQEEVIEELNKYTTFLN